jgi:formate dehydrogenase iron-sulfur subunit
MIKTTANHRADSNTQEKMRSMPVTRSTDKEEAARPICRRSFLKLVGTGGAMALLGASGVQATEIARPPRKEAAMGVLVDTTLCIGCRSCEGACNEANVLPKPDRPFDDETVLDQMRDTSPSAFTVVNKYEINKDVQITRKQQCMHCVEPACSSACIIKAMEKQTNGAVTYRDDLCIGCRYCMVACPFNAPKFEYSSATPLIKKCTFCFERQKEGKEPACVEACPVEALKFGKRSALLKEAKRRIHADPMAFVHDVYGEHEAGGTSWLYIASVPFEQLGLPELSNKIYPELTSGAMSTVPAVLLMWPALLMGFHYFSHNKDEAHKEH